MTELNIDFDNSKYDTLKLNTPDDKVITCLIKGLRMGNKNIVAEMDHEIRKLEKQQKQIKDNPDLDDDEKYKQKKEITKLIDEKTLEMFDFFVYEVTSGSTREELKNSKLPELLKILRGIGTLNTEKEKKK